MMNELEAKIAVSLVALFIQFDPTYKAWSFSDKEIYITNILYTLKS